MNPWDTKPPEAPAAAAGKNPWDTEAPAKKPEPGLMDYLAAAPFGFNPTIANRVLRPIRENVVEPAARYGSGILDTALADVGSRAITGKPLPEETITNALHGKPHRASELWKMAGVPEGPKTSDLPYIGDTLKDTPLDISARGAAAETQSMLTDPLNPVAKGLKGAGKAFSAVTGLSGEGMLPVSGMLNNAGRGAYRNGFRKLNVDPLKFKNAAAIGEHDPSDLLYNEHILESGMKPAQMVDAVKGYLNNKLGPQYEAILQHPAVQAVRRKLDDTIGGVKQSVAAMKRRSSTAEKSAEDFESLLDESRLHDATYYPEGRNPSELLTRATDHSKVATGQLLGGKGGNTMKRGVDSHYNSLMMDSAQAQRNAVQDMAEEALPGSKDAIRELNRKYAIAKPMEEGLAQLLGVEGRKMPVTQVKAGLLGSALADPEHSSHLLGMLGGMLTGKFINSPGKAVFFGNKLRSMSKMTAFDNLLRREAIGKTQPAKEDQQ